MKKQRTTLHPIVLLLGMLISLFSCGGGGGIGAGIWDIEIPPSTTEPEIHDVMLLLIDSEGNNILENLDEPFPSYTLEVLNPEGIHISLQAPYIHSDDSEEVPYLRIHGWRYTPNDKKYEAEYSLISEYIFKDRIAHTIKVIRDPETEYQEIVYIDGVAYPSIKRSGVKPVFYYSTYVVPWD